MSTDLTRLKTALTSGTPRAEPGRKADDIAAALARFDDEFSTQTQVSAVRSRPSVRREGFARIRKGGVRMWNAVTSRAGLTATSGLVAAGVAMVLVVPENVALEPLFENATRDGAGPPAVLEADAPATLKGRAAPLPAADDGMAEVLGAAIGASRPEMASSRAPAGQGAHFRSGSAPAPELFPQTSAGLQDMATGSARALDGEVFATGPVNPLKVVAEAPVSTFSIDVDTASWSILRNSVLSGVLPSAEAVRIEEMVNYFPYAYRPPEPDGAPFRPTVSLSETPWNPDTQILHIGLQGILPDLEDRPALNLVFLVDTSGSMQGPDRLGLLKQSLGLMLGQLRPEDQVAIVTYAGSAEQVLAPTPASNRATILAALDGLTSGGGTAGQAGLDRAYAVAGEMADAQSVTRVILATDGDFNIGAADPEALKAEIARKRESGVYLSVLGFGRGNLDDATMQALAQTGNGQAAYIDTLAEAQKVLVDQLSGTLFPIAGDVKIQVEFNPALVAEYRLIGYETRMLAREAFNTDRVDAGEIGAGHQVTALYEVTPVGSPAVLNDPLRYGSATVPDTGSDELALLRLRYKEPGTAESVLIEHPIASDVVDPGRETRFATAIAGFGQVLRNSPYMGAWGLAEAIALASGARGDDAFGYRAEALRLMRLADALKSAQ